MAERIFPVRLTMDDRRLFRRAARAENKSISEFLRDAARERAQRTGQRRAACLDYPEYDLPLVAERDKDFVGRKLRERGSANGLGRRLHCEIS